MKKYLVLGILALATLVYAGASYVGNTTFTNTMAATGASSSTSFTPMGIDMTSLNTLTGIVVVEPSVTALRGYGLVDTCNIMIKTTLGSDGVAVDSTWKAGLPCTAFVAILPAVGDTAFKRDAYIYVTVADSSADSVFTAEHKIWWDLVAR